MSEQSIPNAKSGAERIDPLFNEAFVRIFGSQRSKNVTRSLVNAVLGGAGLDPIGDIERIDAEYTQVDGTVSCKSSRFDVRLVAGGRLVDLEAQRYPEEVGSRSLYYAAKLISSSLRQGATYGDLPQTIVITLLDTRSLFPDSDEFIAVERLHWHLGEEVLPGSDRMVFIVVELQKFRKRYTVLDDEIKGSELLSWLYMLTAGYLEEEELMAMANGFPTLEEFAELYGFALDDPNLIKAYDGYDYQVKEQKRRDAYYARLEREGLEQGLEQGRKEGLEQGKSEERARMEERMRELGLGEDVISSIVS